MKKFSSLVLLVLAIGIAVPANAMITEDEQWAQPNAVSLGHHEIFVTDNTKNVNYYSQLTASFPNGERQVCGSFDDQACAGATFNVQQDLGVCDSSNTIDCIESLVAIDSSGQEHPGAFKEYIYNNHPNMFSSDGVRAAKNPASPSNWTIPGAENAHGNMYTLAVQSNFQAANPEAMYSQMSIRLNPTEYGPARNQTNIGDTRGQIPLCTNTGVAPKRTIDCSSPGFSGTYNCAFDMQIDGVCLLQRPFPVGMRFKISLRLSHSPSGWFSGRINNPEISIEKNLSGGYKFDISALPVKTPVFYYGSEWSSATNFEKAYWDNCIPAGTCNGGSRIKGLDNKSLSGDLRNYLYSPVPASVEAMNALNFFAPFANDTAVAVPSVFALRTLTAQEAAGSNACYTSTSGVVGIVTTNATAFAPGPPKFENGLLNYKVAGVHYAPDGKTLNEGTYDLVMRSDIARCIYGFSKAPISATLAVVGANGEDKVATTVVGEKDGWLSLSAKGFTYSSPTIQVKIQQDSVPVAVVKSTTIVCVRGKATKRVSGVSPKCPTGYKKR